MWVPTWLHRRCFFFNTHEKILVEVFVFENGLVPKNLTKHFKNLII